VRSAPRWPLRAYVTVLFTCVGVAALALLGWLWLRASGPEPASVKTPPQPARHAPVVRLDELKVSPRRTKPAREARAQVPQVIGVGTGQFDASGSRQGKEKEPEIVRVDPDVPNAKPPSDAEIRRELVALEREQERVEAALRAGQGPATGTGELIWPVRGPITSPFGMRWGRLHSGIDIGVRVGTPVRAADAGRVIVRGWTGGYGNFVCIQHTRSLSTCYGHLSRYATAKGARVRQGQVVAYSGNTGASTGPHLHFETRVNGKPVDPRRYL
jgi:murein DD-endopeptidase MepM/ murein hydrolase activator NlpD